MTTICPHGREVSVCVACYLAAPTRPRKAWETPTHVIGCLSAGGAQESLSDAELAGGMSDAGSEKPLAKAQRRLGKPGPKPGTSRQARYRRRHPARAAYDLKRLRARKDAQP